MPGYAYRGRGLTSPKMIDLVLEAFSGQEAIPTAQLREKSEAMHRQRGGSPTSPSSLKWGLQESLRRLERVGAIERAGFGYWHVIGWHHPESIHDAIRKTVTSTTPSAGSGMRYVKHSKYGDQKGRCARCRRHFSRVEDLTIDHITPRSAGGSDDPANIQLLCLSCNSAKGARCE